MGLDKVGVDKMGDTKLIILWKGKVLNFQTNEENSMVNNFLGFAYKYEPFYYTTSTVLPPKPAPIYV